MRLIGVREEIEERFEDKEKEEGKVNFLKSERTWAYIST